MILKTFHSSLLTFLMILFHYSINGQLTCNTALPINCGQTVFGSTIGVINDNASSGVTTCVTPVGTTGQLWYVYTSPAYLFSAVTINTEGSTDFDTKIHVFTGSCGNFSCVGGDDDSGTGSLSSLTFNAFPNTSYFIRVGGYNEFEGNFQLNSICQSTATASISAPSEVCIPQSNETQALISGIPNYLVSLTINGESQSVSLDNNGTANINLGIITENKTIVITSMNSQDGTTQYPQSVIKNIFSNGYCSTNNPNMTNFMLVQNVTTTGNNSINKTIQIQFDLSWGYSWRDNINWDAAWVFAKYKGSDGLWRHAKLNNSGFMINPLKTMEFTNDKLGAFIYNSYVGQGTSEAPETQIQWNYGLDGLTSVTGLEVRVFAVEMVYVPQGDFNVAKRFNSGNLFTAPGDNFPVVNTRLTPSLTYNDGTAATIRIKGDAGIDSNNDGTVDKPDYPTGYRPFYCYKYELTEQQYADFLNCLTPSQKATIGVAGLGITLSNGEYFSSAPNRACGNMTSQRMLAYADWSGMRPMTILEMNKASYGPYQTPQFSGTYSNFPASGNLSSNTYYNNSTNSSTFGPLRDVGSYDSGTSTRSQSGCGYYGIDDLTGNAREHVVSLNYLNYNSTNGDGFLDPSGIANVNGWSNAGMLIGYDQSVNANFSAPYLGIRYVRSAE
jgi:formylglycine-generating enzyme required for sulfatase activity